ncbi:MAG: hypothetical protein ABL892_05305 [Thiobacillaceae bacterium]
MSKKRILMAWVLAAIPLSAVAEHDNTVSGDKATDMVVDIVVVRPLGLVTTVVGAALTVIALPFTLPSGSVGASAHELIVKPADYTFNRPLGEFYE